MFAVLFETYGISEVANLFVGPKKITIIKPQNIKIYVHNTYVYIHIIQFRSFVMQVSLTSVTEIRVQGPDVRIFSGRSHHKARFALGGENGRISPGNCR